MLRNFIALISEFLTVLAIITNTYLVLTKYWVVFKVFYINFLSNAKNAKKWMLSLSSFYRLVSWGGFLYIVLKCIGQHIHAHTYVHKYGYICTYMYTHNKIHSLKQNKIDKLDFIKVKTIAFQKLPLKKKKRKGKPPCN